MATRMLSDSSSSTCPFQLLPVDLLIFLCEFADDRATVRLANTHHALYSALARNYVVKTRREWILRQTNAAEPGKNGEHGISASFFVDLLSSNGTNSRLMTATAVVPMVTKLLPLTRPFLPGAPFGRVRDASVLLCTRTEVMYSSNGSGYGCAPLDSLLPVSVTRLALDFRADESLEEVTFPKHLQELSFHTPMTDPNEMKLTHHQGCSYQLPITHRLPVGLRVLHLAGVRAAFDLSCLSQLEVLSIASLDAIPLSSVVLPSSIVDLSVGGDFPADPHWSPPPFLTSFAIHGPPMMSLVLEKVRFPDTLVRLVYPNRMSPETLQALPRSLRELTVGMRLLSHLPHLPTLKSLSLQYVTTLDAPLPETLDRITGVWCSLPEGLNWPLGITDMQIWEWKAAPQSHARIPSTLRTLQIDAFELSSSLDGLQLPKLEVLRFYIGAGYLHSLDHLLQSTSFLVDLQLPGSWSGILPDVLPPKLRRLCLHHYLYPLTCLRAHPELREIRVGSGFNHPLPHPLPPQLREWHFTDRAEFNQPLESVQWPSHLKYLDLGPAYNQPVAKLALTEGLEVFKLGKAFQQSDIAFLHLPSSLVHLQFDNEFRQQLHISQIPPFCAWLVLGQGTLKGI